jgi:hypothetical protein
MDHPGEHIVKLRRGWIRRNPHPFAFRMSSFDPKSGDFSYGFPAEYLQN